MLGVEQKSKIQEIEKGLYSNTTSVEPKIHRHTLGPETTNVSGDWTADPVVEAALLEPAKTPLPKTMKLLLGSAIFFVLAVLIALFMFMGGNNIISGENISITVDSPVAVSGGEVLPLVIKVINKNSTTLVGADLNVEFPEGTKDATGSNDLRRFKEHLGDIKSGQTLTQDLSAILFGAENSQIDIIVSLDYHLPGSASFFSKKKVVTVLLSNSPVSLKVEGVSEINANQPTEFKITVTSNSTSVVKNVLVTADYPFGFIYTDSTPKPESGTNVWSLGDLAPKAERSVVVRGVIAGQDNEERGFTFKVGSAPVNEIKISTIYNQSFKSVTVKRPFVSADLTLSGSREATTVAKAGTAVIGLIKWANNLPDEVRDVEIKVVLRGNPLNKSSVSAKGGFYRSSDNTIIFDKNTSSDFARVLPGSGGEVNFSFSSFGFETGTGGSLINPEVYVDLSVTGKRTDEDGVGQAVVYSETRVVKIATDARLFARVYHFTGPFTNSGSMPPRAEQPTTYTVTWTVTNNVNNLSGAKVRAILPAYVTFTGLTSPSSENVSYDDSTRTVTWTVGEVRAGAGAVLPSREASFQISFLPSLSQVGDTPVLVNASELIATDVFTRTSVSAGREALDTRLTSDSFFQTGDEEVVQ